MAQAQDPVCGITLDETEAVATSEHGGERFYFCSRDCKAEFDAHPDDYTSTAKDELS